MTPMRTGRVAVQGPADPVELVRWRRGKQPFDITVLNGGNAGVYVSGSPVAERHYWLGAPGNTLPNYELTIHVPAAERGAAAQDEALYVYAPDSGSAVVMYLVQPSAGCTAPTPTEPQEA